MQTKRFLQILAASICAAVVLLFVALGLPTGHLLKTLVVALLTLGLFAVVWKVMRVSSHARHVPGVDDRRPIALLAGYLSLLALSLAVQLRVIFSSLSVVERVVGFFLGGVPLLLASVAMSWFAFRKGQANGKNWEAGK